MTEVLTVEAVLITVSAYRRSQDLMSQRRDFYVPLLQRLLSRETAEQKKPK